MAPDREFDMHQRWRTTKPDFSPGGAAGLQFIDGLEEVAKEQKAVCFQVMPIPVRNPC
jgi:hypothetical protein